MGLLELSDKWDKINFIDLAGDVLATMDKFISDLNRDQMARKGIRADGSDIKPEYTELTDFLKTLKGQQTAFVTLKDSGDFHDSIHSSVIGDELILDATDNKTTSLLEKYGDEVLGLTDDSISKLRVEFYPKYISAIEKALS